MPSQQNVVASVDFLYNQSISLTNLQLKDPGTSVYQEVSVLGFYSKGDGGGGIFYWDANDISPADNYFKIKVSATGAGRWKRIIEGPLNIKWFGARGDASTDDIAALLDATTYINNTHNSSNLASTESREITLFFPKGVYVVGSTWKLPFDCTIIGDFPNTYIGGRFSANGGDIVSCDNAGQSTYRMKGFQITEFNNSQKSNSLVGLHIGGCKNSVFDSLTISGCRKNGILVNPTQPDSLDTENLTLRNIYTVESGGIEFTTNSIPNATGGSITDFQLYDSQITVTNFDIQSDNRPSGTVAQNLVFNQTPGRFIFGGLIQRVYLQTVNQTMIYMKGTQNITGLTFTDITMELQTYTEAPASTKEMITIDGVQNCRFKDVGRTSMPADGIHIMNSRACEFEGLVFVDRSDANAFPKAYPNKYLRIENTCQDLVFRDIDFRNSVFQNNPTTAISASYLFGTDGAGKTVKIIDNGTNTIFDSPAMSSKVNVLNNRVKLFAVKAGPTLANYSINSYFQCSINNANGTLVITMPANSSTTSNAFEMRIPLEGVYFVQKLGFRMRYRITALATDDASSSSVKLYVGISTSASTNASATYNIPKVITSAPVWNELTFTALNLNTISDLTYYSLYVSGLPSSQSRSQIVIEIQDITVAAMSIPYVPNFTGSLALPSALLSLA